MCIRYRHQRNSKSGLINSLIDGAITLYLRYQDRKPLLEPLYLDWKDVLKGFWFLTQYGMPFRGSFVSIKPFPFKCRADLSLACLIDTRWTRDGIRA